MKLALCKSCGKMKALFKGGICCYCYKIKIYGLKCRKCGKPCYGTYCRECFISKNNYRVGQAIRQKKKRKQNKEENNHDKS